MALYDQHLHTWHSADCEADPADNVRRAIELGLAGLTFTPAAGVKAWRISATADLAAAAGCTLPQWPDADFVDP